MATTVRKTPILQYLPMLLLSAFFSFMMSLRLCFKMLTNGPKKLFYVKPRNVRPAVIDNPGFGEHKFVKVSNLKLHYVAKGSEDKPLMLFLHGFPEFWYSWRYQLQEFSKDFRAIALDMRGYGESDQPSGVESYTLDKLVDDIHELLPALGYKDCYLVGHDWGGAVAWSFAHMYPKMVRKMVICNCPHSLAFRKVLKASSEQKKKSWYMAFFQTPWLPEIVFRSKDLRMLDFVFRRPPMGMKPEAMPEEEMEAFKFVYAKKGALTGPMNYIRAGFKYDVRFDYPTKKVQVPTLMIWGTNDGALSKQLAEASGNYAENYTIKYIEGASHWVQQEEPQLTNKYISEFIKL